MVETLQQPSAEPADRSRSIQEHWRLFQAIADHSAALIWSITPEGKMIYVNGEAEIAFRREAGEDIIGESLYDLLPPELAAQQQEHDRIVLQQHRPMQFEEHFIREGASRTWMTVKFPLQDDHGRLAAMGCIAVDITGQKQMEQALRESERQLQTILASAPVGLIVTDAGGAFVYSNTLAEDMLGGQLTGNAFGPRGGYTLHRTDGMPFPPDELPLPRVLRGEKAQGVEFLVRCADGSEKTILAFAQPIRVAERLTGAVAAMQDITERKQAEKALRAEKFKAENYLKVAEIILLALDERGLVTMINRKGCQVLEYQEEELLGRSWARCLPPEEVKSLTRLFEGSMAGEGTLPEYFENPVLTKTGQRKEIAWHNSVLTDAAGHPAGLLCSGEDITERQRAAAELRKRTEQLEEAQKIAKLGSWEWDIGQDQITWSRELYRIFEIDPEGFEATFEAFLDLVHPEDRPRLQELVCLALRASRPYADDHRIITAAGREKLLHSRGEVVCDQEGSPVLMYGSCQDISEQHRKELELMKIAKLESLGILAGGIAHDFNNILTSILGNIDLANMILPPGSRAADRIAVAAQACERAKSLSQQLLTFAKGGNPVKKVQAIPGLLEEAVKMALLGSNVKASFALAADLYAVEVDAGQLSQVVNNLVINADQAMPEGGTLSIAAGNLRLEENNARGLKAGEYVRIDFTDQGIGIPQKYLDKIFDPYFTTKEKGSGLGLAICYSIVKRHGGTIMIDSVPGEGSTFTILLPASKKEQAGPPSDDAAENLQGSGRILLMDDDEGVAETAAEMLRSLGYSAYIVNDGTEAVRAYAEALEKGDAFRAVITDLTVPGGMGGKETLRRLLEMDPAAKVIVSSGYANDPVISDYAAHGFKGEIPKPYRLEELGRTLRKVTRG